MRPDCKISKRSRGVTLIEVLVGIVIGLVAILVIFQTISVWDARTRASTSGGDAQIADARIRAASDEDDVDGVAGEGLAAFEAHVGEGLGDGIALQRIGDRRGFPQGVERDPGARRQGNRVVRLIGREKPA